jgi:hypothetical protein
LRGAEERPVAYAERLAVRAHADTLRSVFDRSITNPDRSVAYAPGMSPTVFRDGPFRFFFFSREETRMHIHVQSADGEAKFWIEPAIELARNYGLSDQGLSRALQLIVDHEQEIRDAWHRHFGS